MKTILFILLISSIQLTHSAYDEHMARDIVFHMSKISYCDLEKINDWTCESCDYFPNMTNYVAFTGDDNGQAYCAYEPINNLIVLAYSGSRNGQNWMNNLNYNEKEYEGCEGCSVHEGFWRTYDDSHTKMLECYQALQEAHPTAEIVVTGHSQGAAVSEFLVADLFHKLGVKVKHNYNFASPRSGNKKFSDWINSIEPDSYRIVHYRDPVVHLPPRWFGFEHTNYEVFYNEAMDSYQVCPETEDYDCSYGYRWYWISDHLDMWDQYTGCGSEASEEEKNWEITNPLIIEYFEQIRREEEEKMLKN